MTSVQAEIAASTSVKAIPETKIILLWSFIVWLVVMNTTMFNVALPNVLLDLSLTSATAAWIVSGYSIVFAIATLTYSRLSDFVPITRLLLIGLFILGTASFIGFFSNEYYLLLIARVLQATGAGAVPGLAMVLASRYIPIYRRGKAMAYIASAASLGFGLGPVIGGAITQFLGWNYLFLVTGIVFIFMPIFVKLLPKEELKHGKFDIIGGILTAISVTGLLLFTSTFSYLLLGITIFSIIALWKHIHKTNLPFIQPRLFRNNQYLKLLYISFIVFVIHFSSLFLMPLILTSVFQKGPAAIGMIIFPGAILSALGAQIIGRLIDRFGNIPLIMFGQVFLIIATSLFALTSTIAPSFIVFTYMFMSIGFSTLTSSLSNEYTRMLPKADIGTGVGMSQLFQFFGGAFGVTLTGILLTVQEDLVLEVGYRNVFIVLTGLSISAILFFASYKKHRKE